MKGQWEVLSPEQEQIITLTAAFLSLKAKSNKSKEGSSKSKGAQAKKGGESKGGGPRKNEGAFAWKDVAPKAGEPLTKTSKGKTYNWCTNHKCPQWALHNPNSFPNLCKFHLKYDEMKKAWKARGGDLSSDTPTAADIQLQSALACIGSKLDSES
jgi:hypothetical protein